MSCGDCPVPKEQCDKGTYCPTYQRLCKKCGSPIMSEGPDLCVQCETFSIDKKVFEHDMESFVDERSLFTSDGSWVPLYEDEDEK